MCDCTVSDVLAITAGCLYSGTDLSGHGTGSLTNAQFEALYRFDCRIQEIFQQQADASSRVTTDENGYRINAGLNGLNSTAAFSVKSAGVFLSPDINLEQMIVNCDNLGSYVASDFTTLFASTEFKALAFGGAPQAMTFQSCLMESFPDLSDFVKEELLKFEAVDVTGPSTLPAGTVPDDGVICTFEFLTSKPIVCEMVSGDYKDYSDSCPGKVLVANAAPETGCCNDIANRAAGSSLTCSGSANTKLTGDCMGGYFKNSGTPDACDACAIVSMAETSATYTCTSASDSQVSGCMDGYFVNGLAAADACDMCANVTNAAVDATYSCGGLTDSQVSGCMDGYYINVAAPADTCDMCATVTNAETSATYTCDSLTDSQVSGCMDGYWLNAAATADTCDMCATVTNAETSATYTCGSLTDSQVSGCMDGYWLNAAATADTCDMCADIVNKAGSATITCVSASTSQLDGDCADTFVLDTSGDADMCVADSSSSSSSGSSSGSSSMSSGSSSGSSSMSSGSSSDSSSDSSSGTSDAEALFPTLMAALFALSFVQ